MIDGDRPTATASARCSSCSRRRSTSSSRGAVAPELDEGTRGRRSSQLKDDEEGRRRARTTTALDPQVQLRMLTENIPHSLKAGLVSVRRRDRPGRAGVLPRSCARPATTGRTTSRSATTTPTACLDTAERLLGAIGAPQWPTRSRRSGSSLRRVTADKDDRKVLKSAAVDARVGRADARGARSSRPTTTSRPATSRPPSSPPTSTRSPRREDAGKDYAEPVEFFSRTYLTEGLRDLIDRAVRRLSGDQNASPVINLQTNFGGGKTHSMLALWHLGVRHAARRLPAGRPGACSPRRRFGELASRRQPRGARRQPHLAVGLDQGRRDAGQHDLGRARLAARRQGGVRDGRDRRRRTAPRRARRCTSC